MQQLSTKLLPYPDRATGIIKFVNYSTRHIRVTVKGYGVIRNIAVQEGINLGTTDRPIINVNDIADIHLRPHNKTWICTAIHRKIKCSTDTPGIDPNVEVETSLDTADSFTVQQISALETPFDLRLPPIEALGQITLPDFRFPDPEVYLCGIPKCTDCAPDGYVAGMAIVLTTDDDHPFCWKWGFRRAPCPLYFRWQGAIGTGTFAPSVCVVGHYVYAVWGSVSETFLATYDVSDLSLPVLTNLQSMGVYGANLGFGIGAALDSLWVSSDSALTIRHFDITDRTTPVQVAEFSVPIQSAWVIHRHYDTDTLTFTGNPYLVGFHVDYLATPETIYNPLEIVDGYSGSVVGTLDYSAGVMGALQYIVICDNIAIVCTATALSDTSVDFWGVDLTDPTTPSVLWTSTPGNGSNFPVVYLGGNQAYATAVESGNRHTILYTQTNVDDTNIDLGIATVLTESDSFGYFLNDVCLYKAGDSAQANSYGVSDFTDPKMGWTRTSPIETPVDVLYAPNSWIDKEDDILYIAQIGIGGDGKVYLSVFSNVAV